ncbi:MAG: type II secretion system protein [Bacilli bacterium]|nr:type II secretion system protein [Bacilli bacterium]
MKNRRGFTLVEVLAVIVILGILSTIGVVTVINIRKNQEKKFDQNQLAIFKQTAKTYFSDNKTLLPTGKDSTNIVYLKDLIDQNYLDSLLDYNKDSYLLDKSYIMVTRVGTRYIYTPYLYKMGDNTEEYVVPKDENPASFTFDYDKSLTHSDTTYYTNKNSKIVYTVEDQDGIAAFNYAIYKNGKIISTSEYIEPTEKKVSDTFELKANNYDDGTYEIKVTVYDNSDIGTSSYSKKIMLDRVAPVCETKKTPSVEWANVDTTLKGVCSDTNGKVKGKSGCIGDVQEVYKTEMNEMKTPGTVKDKAGNVTNCSKKSVKIDKTAPTCVVSGEQTTWVKGSRTITTRCTDNNGSHKSGCVSSEKNFTFNTTAKTASLSNSVKDKAGNVGNCKTTVNVYIDNTPPTCTSSGGHENWIATGRTLKGTCTDNESGCMKANDADGRTYGNDGSVYWVINWSGSWTNRSPGYVYDKVGNVTACPANQTVRIDQIPPECTYSGQNTVWTKNNVTITYGGTDAGVGGVSGGSSVTYSSGTTSVATIPGYYIKDALGNQKYCAAAHVNVYSDHDKPTCTVVAKKTDANGDNYTENSWTSKNVYTTATCSDTSGSCSATKKVTTTGVTTNVTDDARSSWTVKAKGLSYVTWKVYDAAGNGKACSKFTVKKGVKDRDSNHCECETYKRCSSAGCASYSYGSWTGGCWLYSSGTHGGYQYKLLDDFGNGYGGACTQTGGRVAGYRRSVTCSQYNRGSGCGCETYKECWHF